MQRLFSTFADGLPGGGLLLLRLLAGLTLIVKGFAAASAASPTCLVGLQIIGAAAGVLILAGLWTPIGGLMAGVVEVWIAFTNCGPQSWAVALAVLGISLAMIGPGSWSVDAWLYGRKEILPSDC